MARSVKKVLDFLTHLTYNNSIRESGWELQKVQGGWEQSTCKM